MNFIIRLLMKYLDNGIRQEAVQQEGGKITLKMNKVYGIVGAFSMIFSVIIAIIAVQKK